MSLRRKNETLQSEINRLRELLGRVDHEPEAEFRDRLRQRLDPSKLLKPAIEIETEETSAQRVLPLNKNNELPSALENLDSSALSISKLKVHARPWTALAGDGLVSELISSFFAYDSCFYLTFIDQECFLHDMQAGDIQKAEFCSPLLVNTICALRCVGITQHSINA